MVFTAALVFGHGMPVLSEEESVVDMMRKFLFQLTSSEKRSGGRRGSVDSCDEMEKSFRSDDLDTLELDGERALQQDMTRHIERCLSEAKGSTLCCQVLLLPRLMSAKVARDVVRSSADEPCGLRGAFIKVYLETKDALKSLGCISPDPSVTPTFELSVILKAVDDGWPPLKHILGTDKVLKLRPEYRLVKRKLYSSASPVVHDFN